MPAWFFAVLWGMSTVSALDAYRVRWPGEVEARVGWSGARQRPRWCSDRVDPKPV